VADTAPDKSPMDHALDALVYVPVGLAVSARELLPSLAERGRSHLGNQVTAARLLGRLAVQQGQVQAGKAFERAREEATRRFDDLTGGAAPSDVAPEAPAAPTPEAVPPSASARPTSGPAADGLAIPGYDSLSASQVLPRLEGLAEDELEAVRAYEAAHRGRKTILGRVAQLQAS
jgi:hypothetical protein